MFDDQHSKGHGDGGHIDPETQVAERIEDLLIARGQLGYPTFNSPLSESFSQRLRQWYGLDDGGYHAVDFEPLQILEYDDGVRVAVFSVRNDDGQLVVPERRMDVLADEAARALHESEVRHEPLATGTRVTMTAWDGDPTYAQVTPVFADAAFSELLDHQRLAARQLSALRERGAEGSYPVGIPSYAVYALLRTVRHALSERDNPQNGDAAGLPAGMSLPTRIDEIEAAGDGHYHITVRRLDLSAPCSFDLPVIQERHTVRLTLNEATGRLKREWLGSTQISDKPS